MRALIFTFGTRGDVQPCVALAQRLNRAGQQAAVCTAEGFRALVEDAGVQYLHMSNDMLQMIQDAMPKMSGPQETYKIIRAMADAQRVALTDQWQAAQDYQPTIIVYHPKALGGYHIAEKLRVPGVLALPLPFFTPTREFPIPFIGRGRLGGRANKLSYQFQRFTAVAYGGMINDFRHSQLRLPPIRRTDTMLQDRHGRPVPILYAFSRHVCPIPADYPPHAHVTGYWFSDHADTWQPPTALARFLNDGPPPLYVGFGSMGFGKSAGQRYATILAAVQRVGARTIIATGWGPSLSLDRLENVLVINDAPHDWLFPRVTAVVHHGGSGTTGAGLRAGRPTLICPVLGDQPFWAYRVHQIGAGPDPLPMRRLSPDQLEQRLRRLLSNADYRERAETVGQAIRAEDGPTRAVAVLTAIQHEAAHRRRA